MLLFNNQKINPKDKRRFKLFSRTLWIIFIVPVVAVIVLFTLISYGALGFMPSFEELENPKSNLASEVLSSDQSLLGKFYKQNRTVVTFEEISPYLVNALVATEDERFYEHSGIDGKALLRVIWGVATGNRRGGGSTITQQLAKNLFPRDTIRNRSKLSRMFHIGIIKFKEWVTAVKLERNYTKKEIIVMYLNTVPFGHQAFGVKSAARTFFNKSSDSLKVEEAALLIGLLKAPTRFSPRLHPENSIHRRNVVLAQMKRNDFLDKQSFDSLKQIPIKLDYHVQSHKEGLCPYFREYLRTTMTASKPEREDYPDYMYQSFVDDSLEWKTNPLYGWCYKNPKPDGKPYNLYKDGLRIYTTINSSMQRHAERAVAEHIGGTLQHAFYKDITKLKHPPFSWRMKEKDIEKIMYRTMLRSERYRVLKDAGLDSAAIRKNFNTPVEMTVFRWKPIKRNRWGKPKGKLPQNMTEYLDTVMTPMDSILYYKKILRAGFMSMEPQTGYVRAYVGGIDYKHFKYDHVTESRRQVGSTFKPFLYTLAMIDGMSPCYKVANVPQRFFIPNQNKVYEPQYSDSKRKGEMVTLKYGLAMSLNQISAYLMKRYPPQAVIDIARKLGITSPIDPVPSICVGAAEITLSEMVAAYGTYANKGIQVKPLFVTRIEDKNGNVITIFKPEKKEALSEETAYLMIEMMRGVVQIGTSTRIRYRYKLTNDIAGKTGTTNNNSDGWFIGITPNLVSGAWVGGEERSIHFRSTTLGQGANMALPIWARYMKKVYSDKILNVNKERFDEPLFELSVETDCDKYEQQQHENEFDEDDELLNDEGDIFE